MKSSLVSMTGYGQGSISNEKYTITVEMRSVNSRYLEIKFKLPSMWGELEERMRELISSKISRGRVDVSVFVSYAQTDAKLNIDWQLLESVKEAHEKLSNTVGLAEPLSFTDLLAVEGVLTLEKPQEDLEEIWKDLSVALTEALDQLYNMRRAEGERLAEDITQRIEYIKKKTLELESLAPLIVKELYDRIKERVAEMDVALQEERLLQEVALIAEKMNVTEELVRLKSHCDGFLQIMQENNSVGRKLDFLLQEMNREINTTGSKSSNLTISRNVVEIKSELEKIREQIQNIE
ncbi:MAG: YicC/YloC family endoribonuclease [Bacillota bacterium]|nr:YicC family protein [Bacillota bacterium]HPZ73723.1 YicC family protein [Bacillota bacterium]HQD77922.1 YicC family protein [Bacillota bacterium]